MSLILIIECVGKLSLVTAGFSSLYFETYLCELLIEQYYGYVVTAYGGDDTFILTYTLIESHSPLLIHF